MIIRNVYKETEMSPFLMFIKKDKIKFTTYMVKSDVGYKEMVI